MIEEDASLLPIGTKVDGYEIVGYLGRGGFGITYKVHDALLRADLALKEFFPSDLVMRSGVGVKLMTKVNGETDYRWALRKSYDEARLLAQFDHPNIVRVRRVFEANNTAYMLLDFIKGSTLEGWLQSIGDAPTQEEMDLIAGPLLSALHLVHENRSWHLDISPDNIMIRSADGAPVLLDFGASRFEIKQRSQLVSAMLFKSGYSAPEQYTSNADRYGPWTDIYAAGATFYRAICGKRPTEATSRALTDDLVPASQIGKGRYRDAFLRAIDAALQIAPAARPQTVAAWRSELLDRPLRPSLAGPASRLPEWLAPIMSGAGRSLQTATSQLDRVADRARHHAGNLVRQYRADPRRTIRLSAVPAALLAFLGINLTLDPFGPSKPDLPPPLGIKASAEAIVPQQAPPGSQPPVVDLLPEKSAALGRTIKLPVKLGSLPSDDRKGWLCAHLLPVAPELARALNLASTKGAIVQEVPADGPAGRSGVVTGDIISKLDENALENAADLRRRLQAIAPGTEASLEVWRAGDESKGFLQTLLALANGGNSQVMSWIGNAYAAGLGVARNDSEAVGWFRRGVNAGDVLSMLGLGTMMLAGRGTDRDQAGAINYLLSAARAGNNEAIDRLAGLQLESKRAGATKTLEIAINKGYAPSMVRLGLMYQLGVGGVRKNAREAVGWFRRAADLDDPDGTANLGAAFFKGLGTAKDHQQAVALFRKGAELGSITAMHNLAYVMDRGLGLDKPYPEKAAELAVYVVGSGHEPTVRLLSDAKDWSAEFRTEVQKRLRDASVYAGPIDGEFKQPTIAAIRSLAERRPRVYCNS